MNTKKSILAVGIGIVGMLLSLPSQAQTINNPSFETDTFPNFPGYISANFPITGWTGTPTNKVGINVGGGPFADNGTVPDGTQVAFIQNGAGGDSYLETDITGLTVATKYKVSFRVNARGGNQPFLRVFTYAVGDITRAPTSAPVDMRVTSVGGVLAYRYVDYEFVATDVQQTLALNNYRTDGDNTVVVDNFTIAASNSAWSYSEWNDDATTGIDAQYCYTHAYSFGGAATGAVVNGVGFAPKGGGNPGVTSKMAITGLGNAFGGQARNVGGASNALGNSFIFGGPDKTFTLTGLKPSTAYVATIYGIAWDDQPSYGRTSTFSSNASGDRLTVNLDQYSAGSGDEGIKVEYAYTSDVTGSVQIRYSQLGDSSYHTCAFANREAVAAPPPPWAVLPWTDDATMGILNTHAYTHAYNFGSANSGNVNGVVITGIAGGNPSAANFTTSNLGAIVNNHTAAHGAPNISGDGAFMAQDFCYNGFPTTLNLTGLTPGKQYVLSMFSVGWDPPGLRPAVFEAVPGCRVTGDQDQFGNNEGIRVDYTYTANPAGTLTVTSDPLIGNSIHYYGFTNRELDPMVGVAPTITQEPVSKAAALGGSVTFQVKAIGSGPLTYQWKLNGVDIPLETNPTITITPVELADGGNYTCVVDNGVAPADTSAIAVLTPLEILAGLFDTGVTATGCVLGDGKTDPHYILFRNADAPGVTTAIVQDSNAFPIAPNGPWLANTSTSKWIGPRLNTGGAAGLAGDDSGEGPGYYVYRTILDLTNVTPSTVVVTGNWATDNIGVDIRVNGFGAGLPNTAQFAGYTAFTINSNNAGFVSGLNTVDFVVQNQDATAGYTGLRISGLQVLGEVIPNSAPHIAVHPKDTSVKCLGTTCLEVSANGSATLSYQWMKNGIDIPLANSAILPLTASTLDVADVYSVRVSNGFGTVTSNVAAVTIENANPIANADGGATSLNTALIFSESSLLANDTDGEPLSIASVSPTSAQGGTVSFSIGQVTYNPPTSYTGPDSFTYSVSDGWGGTATGTVNIVVVTVLPPLEGFIFQPGATPGILFNGIPGKEYRFRRSTDLGNSDPWATLDTQIAPATSVIQFTDLAPPPLRAFYHIWWTP